MGSRLPVAELRSAVNVIPLRPQPFCAWFRSCLSSVVALPPAALLRQLSATHSEVGGRGREGRGGRNLGIYLIRSQQPGRALYSSVIFDSKRGKNQNSYGGRGVGGCVCVPVVEGGCFCRGK